MAQEGRSRGIVRRFSDSKGYGFIKPDDDGEDLFVHYSSISSDGFRTLTEGAIVEFTIAVGEDNKPKAIDVTGVDGGPISAPHRSSGRSNGSRGWRRENSSNDGGCYNCGGHGHFARECTLPEKSRSFGGGYGGRGGSGGGTCHTCGKAGHFARECQSGSGGRSGGGRGSCYTCGEFGHLSRDCQSVSGGQSGGGVGGDISCYNCGELGHLARHCTQPKRGSSGGKVRSDGGNGEGCYNCGEHGHLARDCPNK